GVSSDRKIRAAPEPGFANAEFEIRSWAEIDLLSVQHGLALQSPADGGRKSHSRVLRSNKMMAGELAYPEFNPIRPQTAKEARQLSGHSLIHAEHVHWLGIVARQEWIPGRPKPQALLSE